VSTEPIRCPCGTPVPEGEAQVAATSRNRYIVAAHPNLFAALRSTSFQRDGYDRQRQIGFSLVGTTWPRCSDPLGYRPAARARATWAAEHWQGR
jgi:hypothetical protein